MTTRIYSLWGPKVVEEAVIAEPVIDVAKCREGYVYLNNKNQIVYVKDGRTLNLTFTAKKIFHSCVSVDFSPLKDFEDPTVFGLISDTGVLHHLVEEKGKIAILEYPTLGYKFVGGLPVVKRSEFACADFYLVIKDGITSVAAYDNEKNLELVSEPTEDVIFATRQYGGKNNICYINSQRELKDETKKILGVNIKEWVSMFDKGIFLDIDGNMTAPDLKVAPIKHVRHIFGSDAGRWKEKVPSPLYIIYEDGRAEVKMIDEDTKITVSPLVLPPNIVEIKDCPLGTTLITKIYP